MHCIKLSKVSRKPRKLQSFTSKDVVIFSLSSFFNNLKIYHHIMLVLNKPLSKPKSILPTDIVQALERKTNCTISRQQQVWFALDVHTWSTDTVCQLTLWLQDAHELFQIITSTLTSEEEEQYKEAPTSLFDASAVRKLALEKNVGYIVNLAHYVRTILCAFL